MYRPIPPLNALRAFEAAARHLSLTKAALELHVTAGALSHQIRGLEELLGLKLFERRVRSIALTSAGKQLYPGLQTGLIQLRGAVDGLHDAELVIEKLLELSLVPVCSPRLIEAHGPFAAAQALKGVPLIHDDSLADRVAMPAWADWLEAAGVVGVDVSRGLRFNSADHAL